MSLMVISMDRVDSVSYVSRTFMKNPKNFNKVALWE